MTLQKFLSECREKEAKCTKGPWKFWPHDSTVSKECVVSGVKMGDQPVLDYKGNAEFIAFSRNNFLKLVEMVSVLSEACSLADRYELKINKDGCVWNYGMVAKEALKKVEEILNAKS